MPIAFNLDVVVAFVGIVVFSFVITTFVVVGLRDIWDRVRQRKGR
jgi:hypothetical protein